MTSIAMTAATACLAAALAATTAWAQGGKIFDEKQVNESALIEALTPASAESASGVRTRSVKIRPDPASNSARNASGEAGGSAGVMVTFDTGSAALTASAKSALDVVARALSSERLASFHFAVEGHADKRGNPEHNLALSQSRADAVVEYLADQHSIGRDRLKPIGRGDAFPVRPDPAAKENRRVMFVTQVEGQAIPAGQTQ